MAVEFADQSRDGYHVRLYEPSDRGEYLELYESVFDKRRSGQWVQWRYGGPYTDRVRMVVAEREGEVVGAEPFISLPLRAGGTDVPALQPADVMVHPEHRQNGLLTRMTKFAVETYDGADGLFYNFPNDVAAKVHLRLGWRPVGETATAYRINSPSAFNEALDLPATTDHLARGCYGRYDAVVETATNVLGRSEHSVRRRDEVPAAVLESLYERHPPDRLHVPRTAEFYRWRLSSPEWDTTTYVAESEGRPEAALVVCTESSDGVTFTKILDALPLVDPDPAAIERLVCAVVSDYRDSDAIVVAEDTIPRSITARLGFLRNDALPLSLVTSADTVQARPFCLDGRSWSVGDRRLVGRDDWELSLIVQDTSV